MISGVHHIALKAKGLEQFQKTIGFYHDILKMPILRSWGTEQAPAAMLSTGDAMLEIFSDAPDELSAGALRHLAFAVKDTDACVKAVREAGYQITMEPTDISIPSVPPLPARIAFCIGPVGEEVEFFQEL